MVNLDEVVRIPLSVVNYRPGSGAAIAAARAGARSVVTSSGSSWTANILVKNLRAAAMFAAYGDKDIDHLAVLIDGPWCRARCRRLSRRSRRRTSGCRGCGEEPPCCFNRGWVKCCTHRYSVT